MVTQFGSPLRCWKFRRGSARLGGLGVVLVASVVTSCAQITGCHPGGRSDTRAASGPSGPIPGEAKASNPERNLAASDRVGPYVPPARALWFESELGRDAIAARDQGDAAIAHKLLTALVADPETSSRDRAGAHLLLALERFAQGKHEAAARGLALARALGDLGVLDGELLQLEVECRIAAGQPDEALKALAGPAGQQAKPGDARTSPGLELLRADAHRMRDEPEVAREIYERMIVSDVAGAVQHAARLSLAQMLFEAGDSAAQSRARQLLEGLSETNVSGSVQREAAKLLAQMTPTDARPADARADTKPSTDTSVSTGAARLLADAGAALNDRRYRNAAKIVKQLLAKYPRLEVAAVCEARYIEGTAIFKDRERARSRAAFKAGSEACKAAGNKDLEIKTRYQGARAIYAQGDYAEAAQAFESLAMDYPGNSYFDDALVNAGEAWESAERDEDATRVYRQVLDHHVTGDMQADARRRLLLMAFVRGADDEALTLVREGAQSPGESAMSLAKLAYFEGRILARMGDNAAATAAYMRVLELRPLSYPGLQALSRLRERGEAALQTGFDILGRPPTSSGVGPFDLPGSVHAQRAEIWASLGAHDRAREALREAGVDGWPAARVMASAGDWAESQRKIARIPENWRQFGPVGEYRQAWELAHPLPFFDLVRPREQTTALPELLTYAIMQTESRFDPAVTSWAGARGLMQLMPATAKGMAQKMGVSLGRNSLYRAETNLSLGIQYLAQLVEQRGGDPVASALAIPSYNAGSGSVRRWLAQRGDMELDLFIESIPFDETRGYTQSVLGRWLTYRWLYGEGSASERVPFLPLTMPSQG